MSLATILALLAIFFGGRAYLAGWIPSPGKNLPILLAPLADLACGFSDAGGNTAEAAPVSALPRHFGRSSVW